ncbi:hypothetical protein NSA03_02335 [Lactobacillus taiwanensis]|uniref:hypothetical protein n=1 Tax=Lactobacillus taiwanensis TaxID=508451 RepID=UPI000B99C16E|nr:hypothetical protein [Lactobacillus taiwanensis]MCR1916157.1 hypothetical protein [Lactobacillus taiwanensis]OYS16795.1 hypothetical protein CBF69_01315 [Lactobacillus taiwanensis]
MRLTVSQFLNRTNINIPKDFKLTHYRLMTDDKSDLQEGEESLKPTLMGTLIDYLTRIVIYKDLKAFDFIKNTKNKKLIQQLKKDFKDIDYTQLTQENIKLVTRLCLFEHSFRGNEYIDPLKENIEINTLTCDHIKNMLNRANNFFNKFGQPVLTQYKCSITTSLKEKTYVEVYGDGDYLLQDALVDFKVSKNGPTQDYVRQLLIYYIGLVGKDLKKKKVKREEIRYLIIFNPRLDMFYKLDLESISEASLEKVNKNISLELLKIKENNEREEKKKKVNRKRRDVSNQENIRFLTDPFFRLDNGIHNVSREDYKRFYSDKLTSFKYSGQVILIKKDGYYMFFLKTDDKEYMLEGGTRHNISHPLTYYYDNLTVYAKRVEKIFSKYFETLSKLAKEVRGIGGDGKIHGAIVDIDYFNHIYFEPATGSLKYYYAQDTQSRNVYNNLSSLLKDPTTASLGTKETHAKILKKFSKRKRGLLKNNSHIELLVSPQHLNNLITENEKYVAPIKEEGYNKEMYYKSSIMNKVQYLYEHKVIRFWRDGVVENKYPLVIKNTNK